MKLRVSPTSPYVRKVVIFAIETGLSDQIEQVPTLAWAPDTDLPKDNPLGKIPTLIADDGQSVYDSHVICEYLDTLHTGAKLIPAAGPARIAQLRLHALADGILDAGVAVRIELGIRPQDYQWQGWVDRQTAAVNRALDVMEQECTAWGDEFLFGQIAAVTALGYVDYRLNLKWRDNRPDLAAWFVKVSQRPSVVATVPVG